MSQKPTGRKSLSVAGRTDLVDPAEMVLQGSDGWLFLRGDGNNVIGQHTGRVTRGWRGRRRWRSLLAERTKLQDELDFVWAMEIVPDKEAVYPEFLPPSVVPAPSRPVHEILELADGAGAPVHYLLDDLIAAKSRGELYSKTDTHWNFRGSFAAYQAICERLAGRGLDLRILEQAEIRWETYDGHQDLGMKLSPPQLSKHVRADLIEHRSKLVFDNRIARHSRTLIFEQDAPELPSALVFGESFAFHLLIFLKESFRRLAFVHTSSLSPEVVAAERPDVVLSVPIERFMLWPPTDRNMLQGLREMALEKAFRAEVLYTPDEFTASTPRAQQRLDSVITATIPWS
ncbi:hypothetical protein BH10ACT11_BH10ACT11_15520 [soil metagenome]